MARRKDIDGGRNEEEEFGGEKPKCVCVLQYEYLYINVCKDVSVTERLGRVMIMYSSDKD